MPETEDSRVGLVTVDNYLELRFKEAVYWRDDDVEGEDDKVIFLSPPLEVMFRADLNRSGVCKRSGNDGFVVRNVE